MTLYTLKGTFYDCRIKHICDRLIVSLLTVGDRKRYVFRKIGRAGKDLL